MKHGLLLFFNHPFRKVRLFLQDFYRERFDKIHALTPPECPEENRNENVTYFYHGSYNFGGAFSYLLNRPDLFEGMDWVTVLHDDVILNPAFPGNVEDQLADNPDSLSPPEDPEFLAHNWPWDPRMVARMFFPRHPIMGNGNDHALREAKALYDRSQGMKAKAARWKIPFNFLCLPGTNGALARLFLKNYRSMTADFGVPLWKANSDFFMVRRDKFNTFCHNSGVLSRCGIFVEVGIPSALRWAGKNPKFFLPEQLDWNRQDDEQNIRHFQVESFDDIEKYFEINPKRVAIHPIKFSRLLKK